MRIALDLITITVCGVGVYLSVRAAAYYRAARVAYFAACALRAECELELKRARFVVSALTRTYANDHVESDNDVN